MIFGRNTVAARGVPVPDDHGQPAQEASGWRLWVSSTGRHWAIRRGIRTAAQIAAGEPAAAGEVLRMMMRAGRPRRTAGHCPGPGQARHRAGAEGDSGTLAARRRRL